jgi:hypothetical protein
MKRQYMKVSTKKHVLSWKWRTLLKKKKSKRIFVRDKETFEVNIVNKLDLG